MIMIALSTFLCTSVVHVFHRVSEQCLVVPKSIKFIFFNILGNCYGILPRNYEDLKTQKAETEQKYAPCNVSYFKFYRQNAIKTGIEKIKKTYSLQSIKHSNYNNNILDSMTEMVIFSEIEYLNYLEKMIREIGDYIGDTRRKIEFKEKMVKIGEDWKLIALILDRTFFFIFLLVTIITLVFISLDIFLNN
jgi:hypothetical protein